MYYHVIIESNDHVGKAKTTSTYFELDKTETTEIIDSIIIPYLNKQELHFNGYFLKYADIVRISIKETEKLPQNYQNMKIRIRMVILSCSFQKKMLLNMNNTQKMSRKNYFKRQER